MMHFQWGRDLTPDQMDNLKAGEVGLLHDRQGIPWAIIQIDFYGQFWQRVLPEPTFGE